MVFSHRYWYYSDFIAWREDCYNTRRSILIGLINIGTRNFRDNNVTFHIYFVYFILIFYYTFVSVILI